MSSFSKKYPDILTKDDVKDILSVLPNERGISGIAEKCDLTRRTLYQLRKSNDIKQKTRLKILDACMETNPENTLKFLVERSKEKSVSVLMIYLSYIYKKAITRSVDEEFDKAFTDFIKTREKHFRLIEDDISDEIETMTMSLYTKALDYGIKPSLESIKTTKTSHIIDVIPYLIDDSRSGRFSAQEISEMYRVPLELTQRIDSYFEISTLREDKSGPSAATDVSPALEIKPLDSVILANST